jgi:tRNA A37 N6-isopentenylltransferase MiaA
MENEKKEVETSNATEFENLDAKTQTYIKKLREEARTNRENSEKLAADLAAITKAEKEKVEKDLVETNKFKELYENEKKSKSELEKQSKEAFEKAKMLEEIYELERKDLLDKLPDELRTEFANSSKKQLGILLAQIEKSTASPGAKNNAKGVIDVMALPDGEWDKLQSDDPALYSKLKLEKLQKKRKGE